MLNLQTPSIIIFVYGALVLLGGIMGYAKAGSKVSLIAGVVSGLLLFGAGAAMRSGKSWGLGLALAIVVALLVDFGRRYFANPARPLMPGGLMIALSLVTLVAVLLTMRGR